jgi:hypothetical protein
VKLRNPPVPHGGAARERMGGRELIYRNLCRAPAKLGGKPGGAHRRDDGEQRHCDDQLEQREAASIVPVRHEQVLV